MAIEPVELGFEHMPLSLAERPQWLVWRFESKPGDKKPRKVPYYVSGKRRTGEQGSEPDRAALVNLPKAREVFEKSSGKWTGVGFAFLPGDGLIGVDLDGMIDVDTGEISARGSNIIQACASYTEFSPSGKGVHIICTGETETFKSNEVGVEVFCGRQYFTFTGRRYPGTPDTVNPIPAKVLKRLQATVASGKKRALDGKPSTAPPPELEGRAKVESALAYISPNCGYEDWIHIGMAICSELGTAAYDVWDSWSAKGASYPGAKQTAQHWKSFKPGEGVTGATLFKRAIEGGWQPPKRPRKAGGRASPGGKSSTPTKAGAGDPQEGRWVPDLIYKKGELSACLSNVYQILSHRAEWRGVVAFDEFAVRVVKRKPPPYAEAIIGDWSDIDDSRAAMWLSLEYNFTPSSALVSEAIRVLAMSSTFHPVREYLAALKWDGVSRLEHWMSDYLGSERNEYVMRAGKWWVMGAVKRVLDPGCKFDYCLVLEGPQGKGKSTVFSILGGEWFGDTDLDFANKDAMVALGGKLVYELAELGALARSDERRQKSFLTRRYDEYRPHYGRSQIKVPRQLVFGGTTNEWEWNKDPTGGRRFWPVACEGELNLDGLREVRDQLFAEAYQCVLAGERYWPTPEDQKQLFDPQQLRVEQPDALIDALHDWVYERAVDFSLAQAAMEGLKLDASKLTRDLQTRLGIALRKLGCARVEKRNGMTRFWYKPPEKKAVESTNGQPAQRGMGGEHAPF